MALPPPQQQQPQIFPVDLDTQRTDPYKRDFVSTLLRCKGWNVFVVAAGSWSPPAMSTALEAGACVPSLI